MRYDKNVKKDISKISTLVQLNKLERTKREFKNGQSMKRTIQSNKSNRKYC